MTTHSPMTVAPISTTNDETADMRAIAELRREIEQQARLRFEIGGTSKRAMSENAELPVASLQTPSAALWLETRRRICAAFMNAGADAPPAGLGARVRAKVRGAMTWLRARIRSMEKNAPRNSIRGRGIAFIRWVWRSLRNRGWVASPMGPLAAALQPSPPAQSALLDLVSVLQQRDQALEAEQNLCLPSARTNSKAA